MSIILGYLLASILYHLYVTRSKFGRVFLTLEVEKVRELAHAHPVKFSTVVVLGMALHPGHALVSRLVRPRR